MVEIAFLAVGVIGLLHGLEPGHGWPIAVLYSIRSGRPITRALVSSSVISFFHLISSIAVVVMYIFLKALWNFTLPYVNYLAGGALAILGIRFLLRKSDSDQNHGHFHEDFGPGEHSHEHEHPPLGKHTHLHKHTRKPILTLSGIAAFAFVLGFAHEEEFALLAMVVGGINPLALMLVYATAVTIGLVGITLTSVKAFNRFEQVFRRHEEFIPRLSGLVLLMMAASFFLGLR